MTPDGAATFDAESTVIALAEGAAVGEEVAGVTLAADAVCLTDLPCRPLTVTVVLEVSPKVDPGQGEVDAVYLDDFALNLNLPSGYANADGKAGRVLTLVGLGGLDDADELGRVSLGVDSQGGVLEHTPEGDAAGALEVGEYAATIALFEAGADAAALGSLLLGTVYLEATIGVSRRTPDANEYGLLLLAETVTVAAGDGAVGEGIGFVSLTAGADAEVLLPVEFPGGVSMSLLSDSRGAAFYLTMALESEGVLEGTATLTVSISDNGNYETLERTAEVRVSALRQREALVAVGRIVDNAPFASGNVAELKVGDYANALFETGAGSSASLTLDSQSGVVGVVDAIGEAGRYTLAALATSPDFVGAAKLEVVLRVISAFTLDPQVGVPPNERERTRYAPAGYAGSVAFYAAATSGATLRAPEGLPDGFTLGADDARGADFVSPEGFTLFVEEGRISNEGDFVSAAFEITAFYRHFEEELIPLVATVSAIVRPAQGVLRAAYAEPFSHSPSLPVGLDTGLSFVIAGTLGVEGFEGGFALDENNRITLAEVAPDVGTYTISLALDRDDLLATVTLDVEAEISPTTLGVDYELSGLTLANVTVAAGYGGAVYAVSLGAADAVAALPSSDDVDAGFTLALSGDERVATLSLVSALGGGAVLEGEFPLTVIRRKGGAADANYLTFPQTLGATITALPLVGEVLLSAQAPYAVNPAIYDFRAELGGAYASALFGKESGSSELEVSAEGVVSAGTTLAVGGYTLVATMSADAYLGTARATLELTIAPRTVSPDEVVSADARGVTLDAAVGFFGVAYAIPVEEGYTLRNAVFTLAGAGVYDEASTVMIVPEAGAVVSGEVLTLAMEADVGCLTRGPCAALRLTIAAHLTPVGDGGQGLASEVYLNRFARDLVLPAGYASADGKTGRVLTVAGVRGLSAEAFANVSLAVEVDAGSGVDQLVYAPFPVPDNAARFIEASENNLADAKAGQFYAGLAAAMRAYLRFEADYFDAHLGALDATQVRSALVNAAALSGFVHTQCLGIADTEEQVGCYFGQVAAPSAGDVSNALGAGEYAVTIALSQFDEGVAFGVAAGDGLFGGDGGGFGARFESGGV